MLKIYSKPVVNTRKLELGVYGDYGQGTGGDITPAPVRVVDRFEMHMD